MPRSNCYSDRSTRFTARTRVGPPPAHRPELGPCLLWTGNRFRQRGGYGAFYDDDKRLVRAHRVAWELATGQVLTRGQHVLHRCDTPACVRVEHLRLGDQATNMADMDAKGRRVTGFQRGTERYNAVLTDEIVLAARRRFAAGEDVADIVRGLPYRKALKVAIYGDSWKHVEMPSYDARERKIGESKPRCPQGHEFTPENTGTSMNRKTGQQTRYCKQCNRDRALAHTRATAEAEGRTLETRNGAKTHCPQGHPYSPENTRVRPDGYRICRTCHREGERRRKQRAAEAAEE
jgi:hypothetical protein